MKTKNLALSTLSAMVLAGLSGIAVAEEVRVRVSIENVAPLNGTFQTPYWVGFHDATFDTYDGNTPASNDPIPGSFAMERLCEDGNTGPITDDFATLVPAGVDATLAGPNGPLAPGETVSRIFTLDSDNPANQYFSYASMIIPSNDFCISNGNPRAHKIFDDNGQFVANDFFVTGSEVLDAGTEVNDEIPANTAFFGQAAPDTGVDENGVIGTIGSDIDAIGFLPVSEGGILADPRFSNANFLVTGFPVIHVNFDLLDEPLAGVFSGALSGSQEVPPVDTRAVGSAEFAVSEDGSQIDFEVTLRTSITNRSGLRNVTMAHLHLGPAGSNGPVVVNLLEGIDRPNNNAPLPSITGTLDDSSLVGPLSGSSIQDLIAEMSNENIYVNIHTEDVPSGEVRGQLAAE